MASFTFSARTILELGKELISSDEVALYELIKNAVDAGSPTVRINAHIMLARKDYQRALDLLAGDALTPDRKRATIAYVLDQIEAAIPSNADADDAEAFMQELRKASSSRNDFATALASAYALRNWIEVDDDGTGMLLGELSSVFLRIGTRSRRAANIGGAEYLGDKGVGRLSTMRLGDRLEVVTTKTGETHWHFLDIDWSLFSHDREMDIDEISFNPEDGAAKDDTAQQGTLVRILGLHGDWDIDRFRDLLQGKIARMVDPFESGAANRLLTVYHNTTRLVVPSVPKTLLDAAHASAKGKLYFAGNEPVLEGTIAYHRYGADRPINQRGAEIYSLAQDAIKRRGKRGHAAIQNVPLRPQALRDLGPFEFDIYWFNRRIVEKVPGLTLTSSETREQVAQWSGGPMLYRYGFRVLPYGEPSDDWLALDATAFGLSGFKLNRQQVIGRVRVRAPHTALSEQTNRQGLVDSDAATALKTILMWVLHVELRSLINDIDEQERISKREAEERALAFRDTQDQVQDVINQLRSRVDPSARSLVDRVAVGVDRLADQCAGLVRRIDEAVKEVTDEREKFVYLAGIGLMTDFIFHELDRSVSYTLKVLADSQGQGRDAALRSLQAQLLTLQKRISAFDELTGERRQSKSRFELEAVVDDILAAHQNEFERHGVTIEFERNHLVIRAVRGMVIQIVENLLTNAMYWLKQQEKCQTGFVPKIWVRIDPDERTLTIEDNGPGVAPERRELIFQPFISSKPAAQGRGLGLYISRELANHHDWQLYMDQVAGRMRPGRLNMFVLDMGG
ncbi:sensor histidine kinase [Azospirillum isscasi]|uniref:histidine kinase n=1 Tax=Azospirillum isscasi TaxID=3053926 RepID=A0ABU0WFX9_9PROT|nr:sensor histidine kinase [Azospirillum isscasi]MDQ2102529.1 sensor histidine kinase [Azospirillum isscasi]